MYCDLNTDFFFLQIVTVVLLPQFCRFEETHGVLKTGRVRGRVEAEKIVGEGQDFLILAAPIFTSWIVYISVQITRSPWCFPLSTL